MVRPSSSELNVTLFGGAVRECIHSACLYTRVELRRAVVLWLVLVLFVTTLVGLLNTYFTGCEWNT